MPDAQTTPELSYKADVIYGSISHSPEPFPHGSWVYRNEDGIIRKQVPLEHLVCCGVDTCWVCGRKINGN
jgi:hypothetical protein